MLAAELIRAQGIDVLALFFETPFFPSDKARKSALYMDLPFKVVDITARHLEVVKHPRHGYGGNMNPCIDCHALMFRIAGEMLDQEGASFVLTGEVLGQRPMSQNRKSLSLVASESGIDNLLLRPLSAKHLPPTIPEDDGWVTRELLMDFEGRSRKPQMQLARDMNIEEYPSPGGGCLLTEQAYSRRLKNVITSESRIESRHLELLKFGRHFRIAHGVKLVVGRNKRENEAISGLAGAKDLLFTCISVPGPTALLQGDLSDGVLDLAANITISYSDAENGVESGVKVTGKTRNKTIMAGVRDKKEFRSYII